MVVAMHTKGSFSAGAVRGCCTESMINVERRECIWKRT